MLSGCALLFPLVHVDDPCTQGNPPLGSKFSPFLVLSPMAEAQERKKSGWDLGLTWGQDLTPPLAPPLGKPLADPGSQLPHVS